MAAVELKKEGSVHVMYLTNGNCDNTFTLDVINEYLAVLDELEAYKGNTALVVTCDHPKTWCNGIELPWLMMLDQSSVQAFVSRLEELFYRTAMLNMPTIASINGNAYAGGAIWASAFDFRLMRADRGRFCYPEVNIKIPFTEFIIDIIDLIPNKQTLKYLALTGNAMTGQECFEGGVVDHIYPLEELQKEAIKLAEELATKDRRTYTTIKRMMRKNIASHRV